MYWTAKTLARLYRERIINLETFKYYWEKFVN